MPSPPRQTAAGKDDNSGPYRPRYAGQFEKNKPQGAGKFVYDLGDYQGEYVVRMHGTGSYEFHDGSKYDGDWYENKVNGLGTRKWPDGRQYQGEWRDNCMDGIGLYTWPDGRKYVGEYKDNNKHGYGILKFADGRLHIGYWKDGKGHGLGIYQINGSKIKHGIWENGRQVKWLDKATVDDVKNGEKDIRIYFQK